MIYIEPEIYHIPLNYKEGTYSPEEITDFAGETIDIERGGCGTLYSYIVPKYKEEVVIYEQTLNDNPRLTVTYGNDGVIKYIKLYRLNRTELAYINFPDKETATQIIRKFSEYGGDQISREIIERNEKIARIFIGYFYDGDAVGYCVNVYTPEDVQEVLDKYNNYDETYWCSSYSHDKEIMIYDYNDALRIMLLCSDEDYVTELFELSLYTIIERIKENVLEKIDKTDDFKLIIDQLD